MALGERAVRPREESCDVLIALDVSKSCPHFSRREELETVHIHDAEQTL
jgi:hypothetical protein